MKTLIICYSMHHGNTAKVAQVISEILNATIVKPSEVSPEDINEYDLIGFGSGIYTGKHHDSVFQCVKKLPPCTKNAFIFSTRAIQPLTFYHKMLRKRLEQKGFVIINEFSCQGFSTYGPLKLIGGMNKGRPNEIDMENARTFAHHLKDTIQYKSF